MDQLSLEKRISRRRWLLQIYVSGLVVTAIGYIVVRVLYELSPWIDKVDNKLLAILATLASIIVLPWLLGLVVEYGISPLLGKWRDWTDLFSLQDRFAEELASKKIVLINWPDKNVRTPAILTSRFVTDSNQELASVFVPWGPQTRRGYIRIVPLSEIEVTDWSYKELQIFLLSLGFFAPDHLDLRPGSADSYPSADDPEG